MNSDSCSLAKDSETKLLEAALRHYYPEICCPFKTCRNKRMTAGLRGLGRVPIDCQRQNATAEAEGEAITMAMRMCRLSYLRAKSTKCTGRGSYSCGNRIGPQAEPSVTVEPFIGCALQRMISSWHLLSLLQGDQILCFRMTPERE